MSHKLDTDFRQAAVRVKSLTARPTDTNLLQLYSLYKQATVGDNNMGKPGMFNLKNRKKWETWTSKKGMSSEEAKKRYCRLVRILIR